MVWNCCGRGRAICVLRAPQKRVQRDGSGSVSLPQVPQVLSKIVCLGGEGGRCSRLGGGGETDLAALVGQDFVVEGEGLLGEGAESVEPVGKRRGVSSWVSGRGGGGKEGGDGRDREGGQRGHRRGGGGGGRGAARGWERLGGRIDEGERRVGGRRFMWRSGTGFVGRLGRSTVKVWKREILCM